MTWEDIQGWFWWMDFYQQIVSEAPDNSVLVEIGCWRGKSTAFLAQTVKDSGKNLKIWAVDNWVGSPEANMDEWYREAAKNGDPIFDQFNRNLTECGVRDLVNTLVSDSVEAAVKFADKSLFMAFIDGDHRRESVKRDVCAWMPKVVPGGYLAGDDYNRPEVKDGVRDGLQACGLDPSLLVTHASGMCFRYLIPKQGTT